MLSVVIPAYDTFATIGETIDSIVAQTVMPDEIIVVDGGSTDGTGEHPSLTGSTIRVISQGHGGAPSAVNRGVEEAKGDLVAFLDADDLWLPDKLALQISALEEDPDLSGVTGHFESFICPAASRSERASWRVPEGPQPGWLLPAFLVRRSVLDRVGAFDEGLSRGYGVDWFARFRASGETAKLLAQTIVRRRIHRGSLSQPSTARDLAYLETARRALIRRRQL